MSGRGGKKHGDSWLEAYRRTRKKVPPPTRIKRPRKGKGAPYRREKGDWQEEGEREQE